MYHYTSSVIAGVIDINVGRPRNGLNFAGVNRNRRERETRQVTFITTGKYSIRTPLLHYFGIDFISMKLNGTRSYILQRYDQCVSYRDNIKMSRLIEA